MTDAEVGAMARGEGNEIARRIERDSPTKAVGGLVSDKPAPQRISAVEMEHIQSDRGRLSDRVRERLQKAKAPDVTPTPTRARKLGPDRKPGDQNYSA